MATDEPPALRDGIQLAKVREYLISLSKSVTHPEEGSQFGFQTIRRNRDDGSIEYQIFADTEDGIQIAWVQSTRYDAEFIAACLAQAPLFAALLAASPAVPPSPEPTWQTVATAPRDGTAFHAYAPDFIDADFNPNGVIEVVFDGESRFIGAIWNGVHDIWNTQFVEPTHWRRFPAAPEPNEETRR